MSRPAGPVALVAAYDPRVVALVLEALRRVLPAVEPQVAPGTQPLGTTLAAVRPELVVADLNLIEYAPRDLVAQARGLNPRARVIVIAGHADDDRILPALRGGACGFLLKHEGIEEFAAQLGEALAGVLPMTPALARQLIRQLSQGAQVSRLVQTELELLTWISVGDTPEQVAAHMGLQAGAVQEHIRHILEMLHLPPGAGAGG